MPLDYIRSIGAEVLASGGGGYLVRCNTSEWEMYWVFMAEACAASGWRKFLRRNCLFWDDGGASKHPEKTDRGILAQKLTSGAAQNGDVWVKTEKGGISVVQPFGDETYPPEPGEEIAPDGVRHLPMQKEWLSRILQYKWEGKPQVRARGKYHVLICDYKPGGLRYQLYGHYDSKSCFDSCPAWYENIPDALGEELLAHPERIAGAYREIREKSGW